MNLYDCVFTSPEDLELNITGPQQFHAVDVTLNSIFLYFKWSKTN